jgi:hypothetical protein
MSGKISNIKNLIYSYHTKGTIAHAYPKRRHTGVEHIHDSERGENLKSRTLE